nr:hypothetical protein [uncultured Arsenicibacter sp.]
MHTIDTLLDDLDSILNVANIQSYRVQVVTFVNRMLNQKIGVDLVSSMREEKMAIRGHELQLPDYVRKVEDGGPTAGYGQFYELTSEMHSDNEYAFRKISGNRLQFPNKVTGEVYVKFRVDNGIPDEAYLACLEYCTGQILRQHPLHPRYGESQTLIFNAENQLAAEARASLLPDSTASRRTYVHSHGSLRTLE